MMILECSSRPADKSLGRYTSRSYARRGQPHAAVLRSIGALVVASVCFRGGRCDAHQKWLLPNFFVAVKGTAWLSFDVTWSDRPFIAESGVGALPIWVVDPSGRRQAPPTVFVGKTKSVAEVELTEPGTYRLESIDPLTYWTQVEQDGRIQWLQKSKDEVEAGQVKRSDLYWSKATAYVTLGETSDVPPPDDAEPLDLRLEQHPNGLKLGETLKIQVVSRGKPLPRAEVKMFGPDAVGHEPSSVTRCGEDGRCTIQPEAAGRFLFTCQLEREVTDDPKADIHSFNIYLTLEIQPRGE